MKTRAAFFVLLVLAVRATGFAETPPATPEVLAIRDQSVQVRADGRPMDLKPGERTGHWTFLGTTIDAHGKTRAVFEDFTDWRGSMLVLGAKGETITFTKSLEPTFADPATLYRGHALDEVLQSPHDLLGREFLSGTNDPQYADVAACLAPITRMPTYSFVGTRENPDKTGIAYGGKTGNFDPVAYVPAIEKIRSEGKVWDGLVGDWLPVARFVYPESADTWTELVLFGAFRTDNGNERVQPVWYRVCRIEKRALQWAKYFDTYPTFPGDAAPRLVQGFYRDLLAMRVRWERTLAGGMQLDVPDTRLANQARHSLVRSIITRMGAWPKYGVMDRNYGGFEHDGFQDTFNVDVTAMLAWGLNDLAHEYLDNYFGYFVRDDGTILYRGPQTGQYGRMLTVVADYYRHTGDSALLLKHRKRIEGVTRYLLKLREAGKTLPAADAARGLISGWCEADSVLEPEPERYVQPYFSNSAEAVRGFGDLGSVWEQIAAANGDALLAETGRALRMEGKELNADLRTAITRTRGTSPAPDYFPAIAGARELPDAAVRRDVKDPQFRAYRTYTEMLFSGVLTREQVEAVWRYRESHGDLLAGAPLAYEIRGEMAGFLSYGHAYGLLQHDFIREYLLTLYSLSAHQYTRGSWTAPETRQVNPQYPAAPYCPPAQLVVPLLVRWQLAFEEPLTDELWLAKATPREWLADGKSIVARAIPTRWGRVDLEIHSHLRASSVDAVVQLPPTTAPEKLRLRLRIPENRPIEAVTINDQPWTDFDADTETITVPTQTAGKVVVGVMYR